MIGWWKQYFLFKNLWKNSPLLFFFSLSLTLTLHITFQYILNFEFWNFFFEKRSRPMRNRIIYMCARECLKHNPSKCRSSQKGYLVPFEEVRVRLRERESRDFHKFWNSLIYTAIIILSVKSHIQSWEWERAKRKNVKWKMKKRKEDIEDDDPDKDILISDFGD